MAYGLKIMWEDSSVDVKYERLRGDNRKVNGKEIQMDNYGSPKTIKKTPAGIEVIGKMTKSKYDTDGNQLPDDIEVLEYFVTVDGEEIPTSNAFGRTEVLNIKKFEPLEYYTDRYIIDAYYQLMPSSGKSKKDYDKAMCKRANTLGLKKLWDKLYTEQVVGKAEFNMRDSKLPNYAFVRAVKINGTKWTLEIGRYKQQKLYSWVEEDSFKTTDVKVATPIIATPVPQVDEI